MTFIELLTENESVEKARKSLFVASISVPLFAGVNFLSEEITLFGLTVQVSHDRIVDIGRVAIIFLLIIFLLRLLPVFISWIHSFLEVKDKKWEDDTKASFPERPNPGEDYWPDPESHEIRFQDDKSLRDKRRLRVKAASNFTANSVTSLLNFVLPVSLAVIAVARPYYLSYLLVHL